MSKGLEALKNIRKVNYYEDEEEIIEDCFGIEKDLSIIEKELKALEIIKELPDKYKQGLVYILLNALNERKITQEKYDLLKEVLL